MTNGTICQSGVTEFVSITRSQPAILKVASEPDGPNLKDKSVSLRSPGLVRKLAHPLHSEAQF